MLLPRPFIHYVAKELTRRLGKGACQFRDPDLVQQALDKIILDEIALEESINAEARELLNQYSDYMRQNQISYQEMFNRVKRNILEERKVTAAASRDGKTKVSRDKITELSHKVGQQLPRIDGVRVLKRWNDVRLEVARELTNILVMEQKVDDRARDMITSQKRDIVEGGQEWQVLHRRYYEQEMLRLGVDMRMPETGEDSPS